MRSFCIRVDLGVMTMKGYSNGTGASPLDIYYHTWDAHFFCGVLLSPRNTCRQSWMEMFYNVLLYIPIGLHFSSFLSRGILLWIELKWPENPANTYARHMKTLDSCFDLIRFQLQCIPWSSLLEIEPATTDCNAETVDLASLVCDMNGCLSCRVSKQPSSVSVCRA